MTATPETFDTAKANGSAQPEADTTLQWGLTPEQEAIRALAREVSEREFRDHALEWERTGEFPWRNLKILAETGLLGAAIPEEYGGAGGSWLEDRKSTRLNSSHANISYAVFCLKKK